MRVALLQRVLPHYRVGFVERLHARLATSGVELRLAYGKEHGDSRPRTVRLNAHWAVEVQNSYWGLGGAELVWQPCLDLAADSDLVIIEQSNRLLINYLLQLRRAWTRGRVAFWGHGKNMQSRAPDGWSERLKRRCMRSVDWWFAYTGLSRDFVKAAGFPETRITVVNNSIDATGLEKGLAACAHMTRSTARHALGCRTDEVALYCGALHADKRIEFLLDAACAIRRARPDFELLIVGDGPMRSLVEAAAQSHSWIHYRGMHTGEALAPYLYAAKLLLMPGLVGLVVVDSFVAGVPLVTTEFPYHSPEIAYLESGVNGVVARNDVQSYAQAVIRCMEDDALRSQLQEGCRRSARRFSLDSMVENFAGGIERCLARV